MEGVLHVYPLIFCLLVGSFIHSSIYSFIQYLIIPQHITVPLPRVKMFALRSSQSSWKGSLVGEADNRVCEYLTGDSQRLPKRTDWAINWRWVSRAGWGGKVGGTSQAKQYNLIQGLPYRKLLSVLSNIIWVTLLSCLRSLEVGRSKWPQLWVGCLKILLVFPDLS